MNGVNSNLTQTGGVFTGAYAKRQQEAHKTDLSISEDRSESIERSISEAAKSLNISNEGVKLSISKEDMDFLTSEDENRLVFLVAITYLNDDDEDD